MKRVREDFVEFLWIYLLLYPVFGFGARDIGWKGHLILMPSLLVLLAAVYCLLAALFRAPSARMRR